MFKQRPLRREQFFQGHWHDSPFHKGDLKYVILNLLKEKPRYGYEIIRELEEYSYGFYKPSPGVVYPTLQMLEEMEYTTSEERDGKKVYVITEAGLRFLKERSDTADEVRQKMSHHWNSEYFDMFGQIKGEFKEMGKLMRRRAAYLDAKKMQRIRDIIVRASKEIESVVNE
jgi:DNA-binding PadR family transcriptional regulator